MVDHSGSRTPLWRSVTQEVGSVDAVSRIRGHWCDHLPVDVLGLLSGVLSDCESFHWRSGKLWNEECGGSTIAWVVVPARDRVLLLSAVVLHLYGDDRGGRDVRKREDPSIVGLWLVLGDDRVSHLAEEEAVLDPI